MNIPEEARPLAERNKAIKIAAINGADIRFGDFLYVPEQRMLMRPSSTKTVQLEKLDAVLLSAIATGAGAGTSSAKKFLYDTLVKAGARSALLKVVDQRVHRLRLTLEAFEPGCSRHLVTVSGGYQLSDEPSGKALRNIRKTESSVA